MFSRFGKLYQERSGNPGANALIKPIQAAMLMNKLKAGAETSKLLAAAAAAASTPTSTSTVSALRNERPKGRGRKQNQVNARWSNAVQRYFADMKVSELKATKSQNVEFDKKHN
jgi:hypothetical protein